MEGNGAQNLLVLFAAPFQQKEAFSTRHYFNLPITKVIVSPGEHQTLEGSGSTNSETPMSDGK